VEEGDGTAHDDSHERMNENMNYRNPIITSGAIYLLLSAFIVITLLPCSTLYARMTVVGDSELSQISAQAGITYNFGDSQYTISAASFAISDTDSTPLNWLEFNNLTISGSWDENPVYGAPFYQFNTIDVATITNNDDQIRTVLSISSSDNTYPQTWNIGNLVFCSQNLGSINFDIETVGASLLNITAHGPGSTGIEFEYLAQLQVQNFNYAYNNTNTSAGSLNVSGIHLSQSATGDPTDPTTWAFSGPFRIGDIVGGNIPVSNDGDTAPNPATFDVGSSPDGTSTAVVLNLPMQGSIRAQSVNFGGTNLGPVAIDGITVHHLIMSYSTGN